MSFFFFSDVLQIEQLCATPVRRTVPQIPQSAMRGARGWGGVILNSSAGPMRRHATTEWQRVAKIVPF